MSDNKEYSASAIKVLKGLEAVRERPGMYIGNTDEKGLLHLVYEVIDNSIDESMAGYCDTIKVNFSKDRRRVTIEDNGRGIPVDIHPEEGISSATVVLTVLHAGGKFDSDSYEFSGGLHGVGISVVNALSSYLKLTIYRDQNIYEQEFKKGIPLADIKIVGKTRKQGTKVEFTPDDTIFKDVIKFNVAKLSDRFSELTYLNNMIKIIVTEEGTKEKLIHRHEGGLKEFISDLNRNEKKLTGIQLFHGRDEYNSNKIDIKIALVYQDTDKSRILSYVNNIKTIDGGTHESGFKAALTRSITTYISKNGNAKEKGVVVTGEDCLEGLIAIVSVKMAEAPQFEGQTKGRLGTTYIKTLVQKHFLVAFTRYLEENPNEARSIMGQVLISAKGRDAAKRAKDLVKKKDNLSIGVLPGKLSDCHSKDPAISELYLVEGDSAGGCHSGTTLVKCANGKTKTMSEMAIDHAKGIVNFIYTYNHDTGLIEIQAVQDAWRTKKSNDLVYVGLGNGKKTLCTSDHPYMLRDGSYKPAGELTVGDSLMPLYISEAKKDTYVKSLDKTNTRIDHKIKHPDGSSSLIYHLADEWNIRNGIYPSEFNGMLHRHHINKDTLDNRPYNIIRLTRKDHLAIHNNDFDKQTPEYREYMSKKMKEQSDAISKRVKEDWKDPEYRAKFDGQHKRMRKIQLDNGQTNTEHLAEHWSKDENRVKQSDRVTKHYQDNPEAKQKLRDDANTQWDNEELRKWRAEKTKEQMSNPDNIKRKLATERDTRIRNSLGYLNSIGVDKYEEMRKETKNRKVFTLETLLTKMNETGYYQVVNNIDELTHSDMYSYSHKVVSRERYTGEPIDVYDIEVPNTHNFALASGVFVHNSSRQGRDRHYQAILPLKGKILNVEKASLEKILKSEEVKNIVRVLNCGVGNEFDITALRYHKIVIMTDADVDGAHIQTLLLTLFYRQFPQIIERGFLYIAQPPLYQYSVGKSKKFILDDHEYKNHMIDVGVRHLEAMNYITEVDLLDTILRGLPIKNDSNKGNKSKLDRKYDKSKMGNYLFILKKQLGKVDGRLLLQDISGYVDDIGRLTRGKNLQDLIRSFVELGKFRLTTTLIEKLMSKLEYNILSLELTDEHLYITAQTPDGYEELDLDLAIFQSKLYKETVDRYDLIMSNTGDVLKSLELSILLDGIILLARKGAYIQRYKGLGEMNPSELWETTLDPSYRTHLRVIVGSDEYANEVFKLFMGDEVEPRREYISNNAINAKIVV